MQRLQGAVVGDFGVGKTSMLYSMVGKPVPDQHVPTLLESYCVDVPLGGGDKVELVLWDTPGSEDHMQLTQMGLDKKDFVILCFSLVDPKSLESVRSRWIKEIRSQIPSSVVFLVGTKLDMRNNTEVVEDLAQKDMFPVSTEQGEQLKEVIGAVTYIECSSQSEEGIATLLEQTARKVCEVKTSKKRRNCAVM